jgi:S-formylglutathione hydrolase
MESISQSKVFGGKLERFKHASRSCHCEMTFSVFLPPQAEERPVPMLYWLSGLTCTDENFMIKSGAQRAVAELGIALIAPDTSPRGVSIPGEDDDWDFGSGAGFYVNATEEPWSKHYRMYDYITKELPELVEVALPLLPGVRAVSGHSMGGHGALVVALKNKGFYRSVSAFAPICNPTRCPWGEKAFKNYLGDDQESWKQYDATELLRNMDQAPPMLIDQGTEDSWLHEQLLVTSLQQVCADKGHALDLRMQEGYDHGYYFVASFIDDHLRYHAERLSV